MTPTPTQPNLAQYSILSLYLFAVYLSRTAYQAATGKQAPPFDPTKPVKGWADPNAGASPQTYSVFDSGNPIGGFVSQVTVPAADAGINLPGTYAYPAYVERPTDAEEIGPFGVSGQVSPDTVCLQADAQSLAAALAPLYAPKPVTVVDNSASGVYRVQYGTDPRRQWAIAVSGSIIVQYAQTLIKVSNQWGVGVPVKYSLVPTPGVNGQTVVEIQVSEVTQVTTAPAGAATAPAPIRPLLPNEQIVAVPPGFPGAATTYVVERTDMQQPGSPSTSQQLADLTTQVAQLQSLVAELQSMLQQVLENQPA